MELPQIRIINDFEKKLVPLAKFCNVDLIWVHPHAEIFESTLGYSLNQAKIPALVIETGICLRINKNYCEQIVLGILNLLQQTGTLDGRIKKLTRDLQIDTVRKLNETSKVSLFISGTHTISSPSPCQPAHPAP